MNHILTLFNYFISANRNIKHAVNFHALKLFISSVVSVTMNSFTSSSLGVVVNCPLEVGSCTPLSCSLTKVCPVERFVIVGNICCIILLHLPDGGGVGVRVGVRGLQCFSLHKKKTFFLSFSLFVKL